MKRNGAITRRVLLGTTAAVGADLLAGCGHTSALVSSSKHAQAPVASTSAAPVVDPAVLFGAWHPGGPAGVRDLEEALGRRLAIVHWFQGWGVPAPASEVDVDRATAVIADNAIPMITWEPWDYQEGLRQPEFALSRILAGDYDEYIRRNARTLASLKGTVWLRFAHDMNIPAFPWSVGNNGTTAADYVAVWKRVVRLVREEGATNVQFVWCPNVPTPTSTSLEKLWPGDDYVDYLGMDGYNWGHAGHPPGWPSLHTVFAELYGQLLRLSKKPVVIAEVGCANIGGDKAQWIKESFGHDLTRYFPGISAVVWYDEVGEADWRLDSSAATLKAARAVFDKPPYVAPKTPLL